MQNGPAPGTKDISGGQGVASGIAAGASGAGPSGAPAAASSPQAATNIANNAARIDLMIVSFPRMRIVSLIASSTEIVCALGFGDQLVGRSHECDFPPWVQRLPVCTGPKFATDGTSYEIDQRVKAILAEGLSVYRVDAERLRALVLEQSESLGIPLREIRIPPFPPNEVYEARMRSVLEEYAAQGIHRVGFGDLFLDDIRSYREQSLARLGMRGLYPIWKRDTAALAREFIALGFRAVLVCVDLRVLDRSFAGRLLDERLLADLPASVDPCGENGEFHTFVFDGPGFRNPIGFDRGAVREESAFAYCDLTAS